MENPIFEIPLPALLRYLAQTPGGPEDLAYQAENASIDWHLVLREGMRQPLHLNLGIPGLEEPDHPIEEGAATLYAALALDSPTLPVILSGELDLAVAFGLIPDHALDPLRHAIWEEEEERCGNDGALPSRLNGL